MIPQIIYLSLIFVSLLLQAHQHGKPREGNHSFWAHLTSVLIIFSLLYAGGFFDGFVK